MDPKQRKEEKRERGGRGKKGRLNTLGVIIKKDNKEKEVER